jgi:hypothetical protein
MLVLLRDFSKIPLPIWRQLRDLYGVSYNIHDGVRIWRIQINESRSSHRIDTRPEGTLRRYFVRNFTSADVKIRHHMTPSWSAHGRFS